MRVWRLRVPCVAPGRACRVPALLAASLAVLVLGPRSTGGAELRLRSQCQCAGPVVTLGDVAEVLSANVEQAAQMAAIELFPAPAPSRQRYLPVHELQDLLLLRGVNLTEHRLSGSNQVAILGSQPTAEKPKSDEPLPASAEARAQRRVREALVQYLQQGQSGQNAASDTPWIVQFQLQTDQMRLAANPAYRLAVAGGAAPWVGQQRFEVIVETPAGPVRFPLDAEVSTTPAMATAVRAMPRGAILRAGDVTLRPVMPGETDIKGFPTLEEVIGKETTQAIVQGKVLDTKTLREPLLVQRREVVTVFARAAGISVKTVGRAQEEGSLGELIAIESMHDRKTYFARVSGVREVEVLAHAIQTAPTAAGARPVTVKPSLARAPRPRSSP